jgi:MerR family transcriptional regulator, copper efflux regulator
MQTLDHAQALERGLRDIGGAAKESGVSVKMIRHYESIGILPQAARTLANYRVYGPNEIHALRFIRRARTLGFSMEEIRELLGLWRNRSRSSSQVHRIAGRHVAGLKRKIAELRAMVGTLEHLMQHCHGDDRPQCPILDDLAK